MADQHYIRSLFFKFLSDECTPAEIEEIANYLKTSTNADGLPGVEEVKARLGPLPKIDDHHADLIFNKIINTDRELKTSNTHSQPAILWWRVAATITGILLLSWVLFLKQDQALYYTTSFGETKTILLPDGTEVTLNANSELRLAEEWREEVVREVWLEGEAFFSVVHTQDDRKFLVHTSNELSVEVLGTQFNVNSRKNRATVVLNSGKVKVHTQKEGAAAQWIMLPGDLIAYEHRTQQVNQKTVDTTLYTSWRNNLLLFKDTPLKEIAYTIRNNYGYQVSFENDSLAQLRFTGSNPADQLELLLRTLELSFDLQIAIESKRINIESTE